MYIYIYKPFRDRSIFAISKNVDEEDDEEEFLKVISSHLS